MNDKTDHRRDKFFVQELVFLRKDIAEQAYEIGEIKYQLSSIKNDIESINASLNKIRQHFSELFKE